MVMCFFYRKEIKHKIILFKHRSLLWEIIPHEDKMHLYSFAKSVEVAK